MTDKEHLLREERSYSKFAEKHEALESRISESLKRKQTLPKEWTKRDEHWLEMDGFALRCSCDRRHNAIMDKLYTALKR